MSIAFTIPVWLLHVAIYAAGFLVLLLAAVGVLALLTFKGGYR